MQCNHKCIDLDSCVSDQMHHSNIKMSYLVLFFLDKEKIT